MKCSHNWKPSHNDLGLFAWKCDKCGAIQEADPHEDQPLLLAYAQTLNKQFIKALEDWQNAPKAKKTDFASQVHALYWVTRISYLRAGIKNLICQTEDLERQFPCPPQLNLVYSLLKPRLPRWDELAEPIPSGTEEEFDTLDKPSRNLGKEEVSTNNFPRSSEEEFDTLDKPSRNLSKEEDSTNNFPRSSSTLDRTSRKKRKDGSGSASIFVRTKTKGNKVYPEHWLKYSEKGNQKSRYIPKKKVKKVQEMNEQKASVTDIIAFLENKD